MTATFKKAVWGAIATLACCATVYGAPHSGIGAGKLDQALHKHGLSGGQQQVIVTIHGNAKPGVRKRLEALGGKVVRDHGIINALTVSVDSRGLQGLVNDPDVDHISTDADMGADVSSGGADTTVVSNLKQMLALQNWFTGSTVTIAVIDSGIANTADFTGRIIGTYDFTNGQPGVAELPNDGYGHGTHVAGLAGASGAVSNGSYAGVVSGVKLLSLKVLSKNGAGKASDVIDALQFAVANKAAFNIGVINLSLGHPVYESVATDPLVQAVEAAVRAGIVVVTAAGNVGVNPATGLPAYGGITSPGNAPSAITVGAALTGSTIERADDRVATFSSRGPTWLDGYAKPDVVAPGYALMSDAAVGSTLATTYPSLVYPGTGGSLMKLSGSSMATGVVSGLVAAMIEAQTYAVQERYNSLSTKQKRAWVAPPALTPNAIKAMLMYSATPLRDATGATYDALTQGTGEVDGVGGIELAYFADTSKTAGTPWLTSAYAPFSQFGTESDAWAQNIVWGTVDITGSDLVNVNQSAWTLPTVWGAGELDNIVWGTSDVGEQDNIVWGTSLTLSNVDWSGAVLQGQNIVWGTSLGIWADNIVWGTSIGIVEGDNIVWGTSDGETDNIVWGTMTDGEGDNIVWGTVEYDNIVWGTSFKNVLGAVGGGAL